MMMRLTEKKEKLMVMEFKSTTNIIFFVEKDQLANGREIDKLGPMLRLLFWAKLLHSNLLIFCSMNLLLGRHDFGLCRSKSLHV